MFAKEIGGNFKLLIYIILVHNQFVSIENISFEAITKMFVDLVFFQINPEAVWNNRRRIFQSLQNRGVQLFGRQRNRWILFVCLSYLFFEFVCCFL